MIIVQVENRPMKERLFLPFPAIVKPNGKDSMQHEDNEILTDNLNSGSEGELDIICNMVFVLPIEFDHITKVTKEEDDCFAEKDGKS